MNFNLTQIPERTVKPRQSGITMVMDKGLSIEEAKNLVDKLMKSFALSLFDVCKDTKKISSQKSALSWFLRFA